MKKKPSVNLKRRAFLTRYWHEHNKTEINSQCLNHKRIYCQSCKDFCHEQAIVFSQIKMGIQIPFINLDKCTHCQECLKACPVDAIKISDYKEACHES